MCVQQLNNQNAASCRDRRHLRTEKLTTGGIGKVGDNPGLMLSRLAPPFAAAVRGLESLDQKTSRNGWIELHSKLLRPRKRRIELSGTLGFWNALIQHIEERLDEFRVPPRVGQLHECHVLGGRQGASRNRRTLCSLDRAGSWYCGIR